MRLVCPNCEAKYEVPDDAIPDSGRDVQCANCGHAWFQGRARPAVSMPTAPLAEPAPAVEESLDAGSEAALSADPAPDPIAADDPDEMAPAPAAALSDAFPEGSPDEVPEPDEEPEPVPASSPEPEAVLAAERASAAYAVDDSVLAILREEAEREASARRAESRAIETQTDLGLEELPAARAVPDAFAEVEAKPAPRRDLLPDVEEINSTLRPSAAEGEDGTDGFAPQAAQRGPGFRGGFLTVMVLAVLAAGAYLGAPQIAALSPALEGPLATYVDQVDGLRLTLDGMMRSATVAINGN